MLPFKASDRLTVEKDGAKYSLKYLIGGLQAKYMRMMQSSSKELRTLGRLGEKLKTVKPDDIETQEKMCEELDRANDALAAHRIALVEMFLESVDGVEVTLPLSDCYRPGDIDKLVEIVQENLPALAGNEVPEIKNLSRPLSSVSTATDSSTGAIDATAGQKPEGDA
jgi:hypothetical protein